MTKEKCLYLLVSFAAEVAMLTGITELGVSIWFNILLIIGFSLIDAGIISLEV